MKSFAFVGMLVVHAFSLVTMNNFRCVIPFTFFSIFPSFVCIVMWFGFRCHRVVGPWRANLAISLITIMASFHLVSAKKAAE